MQPALEAIWQRALPGGGVAVDVALSLPARLQAEAGAPAELWLRLESPPDSPQLRLSVAWRGKTPTRMPEALWLTFRPAAGVVDEGSWRLHKLGGAIDPGAVMLNGSQGMHAVGDEGVSVTAAAPAGGGAAAETLRVRALDAPLVSPGVASPFPNGVRVPDMREGVSFALVNNIWATNYVGCWPAGVPHPCLWRPAGAATARCSRALSTCRSPSRPPASAMHAVHC
jgi:hypothetical protein